MYRIAIAAVLFTCGALPLEAETPVISYANEGTRGDETLLLAGAGFVPGKTRVVMFTPELDVLGKLQPWRPQLDDAARGVLRARASDGLNVPPLPQSPPKESRPAKVLTVSAQAIACALPRTPLVNTHHSIPSFAA